MIERERQGPRGPVQLTRPRPAAGGGPESPAGVIRARRGSGGQRALIGGLLVATAAVVVFAAVLSAAGSHETSYVVAARPLAAGSIIGPGDVATSRFGLPAAAATASFRQPDQIIGRSVAVAVQPGQLIESTMLGDTSLTRLRPVSIPVDTAALAALVAGDPVDVLSVPAASAASSASSGSSSAATQGPGVIVVMRGATLLSVGQVGSGLLSGSGGGTVVVTLGVADLQEAEQLVAAAHAGTVELVRAEPTDGTGPGAGTSDMGAATPEPGSGASAVSGGQGDSVPAAATGSGSG